MGTGPDGTDDLLGLRGSKNELNMVRRFLHQFEERVETLIRDHVGLVNDEDLVAVTRRGEGGPLNEVASIIHSAVAGGVHLHHVE